jgi:hypothetical protein
MNKQERSSSPAPVQRLVGRPVIPGRMLVKGCGQHQQWFFRCDDRNGYLLSILWASDGDLHLSIVADPDHENYEENCHRISGSIRLRLPMIGGGMYEHLQPAIMDAMRAELAEEKCREQRMSRRPNSGIAGTPQNPK